MTVRSDRKRPAPTRRVMHVLVEGHVGGERVLEEVPVLVDRHTLEPLRLPLRWVMRDRRWAVSPNTIAGDLRAVRALYDWYELEGPGQIGVSVDADLGSGMQLRPNDVDRLIAFIRTRVVHVEAGTEDGEAVRGLGHLASMMHRIRSFLLWCAAPAYRGAAGAVPVDVVVYEAMLDTKIAALESGDAPDRIEPLDAEADATLRRLIFPRANARGRIVPPFNWDPANPFQPQGRVRNWLMYVFGRDLGLRRGEILKVKEIDIQGGREPSLAVVRRPNDRRDLRRRRPGVKRGGRHLPIAVDLVSALRWYRNTPMSHGGRYGARSPYLFVNTRDGEPLSVTGADKVIARACEVLFPKGGGALAWHTLRHTWAEDVAAELLAQPKRPDEQRTEYEAIDILRKLGGWADDSNTPARYIRNVMRRRADDFGRRRQERLWGAGADPERAFALNDFEDDVLPF